jgi:hypothetical protein
MKSIGTGRATNMITVTKALFSGMTGLLLGSSAYAQFLGDPLLGNVWARGAKITIYQGTEQQPSMIVRANTIFRDYQRKSFFRIGVLPIGVMEGVTLEVRDVESITNSLAQLDHWLGPRAGSRLELRQVTIQIAATVTNRLQAGRIHVLPGGKWELVDDVRLQVGTNQMQAAHATLQVAGERTGTLVMATTPPWTTNILALSKSEFSAK